MRRVLADDVARLVENDPGVRHGVDPEAVHQARVATRRLRSQLRTFRPALKNKAVRRVAGPLRSLAGMLGAVRDADVLAERLATDVTGGDRGAGEEDAIGLALSVALSRLRSERDTAFEALLSEMDGEGYHSLLVALSSLAKAPPTTSAARRPAGELLEPPVRRTWAKLEQEVATLPPVPSDSQLHRVRIRAKRARYAAQAAAAFSPEACGLLVKHLTKLQDVLGALNDGSRAVAWLEHLRAEPPSAAETVLSGIDVLIARERAAMATVRAEWHERYSRAREAALQLGWAATG